MQLTPREVEAIEHFLDPHFGSVRSATAWVYMQLRPDGDAVRIDIPHRKQDELDDLIETLYRAFRLGSSRRLG